MFFSDGFFLTDSIRIVPVKREAMSTKTAPRSFHTISYRFLGNATISDQYGDVELQTGDILFIPANLRYATKGSAENLVAIHFTCKAKLYDRLIKFTPKSHLHYEKKFMKLQEVWQKKQFGYEYECVSIVYSILSMIEKELAEVSIFDKNKQLSDVMDYINENYTNSSFTVSDLALMCGMSETFFRKTFKEKFKVSPLKYVNNLKLKYALELLASNYYRISEVAEKSGFSSVYYFSSFIKKETGYSPGELMKNPEIYKIAGM